MISLSTSLGNKLSPNWVSNFIKPLHITDPILGKKEQMYSKDFTDSYISYHYVNIPYHPEIEVYLKYKKHSNNLISITIRPTGSPGDFILNDYSLNVLDQLKLKITKEEKLNYSKLLSEYQLSDGIFNYEIVGKTRGIEELLPEEFYSFRIYVK